MSERVTWVQLPRLRDHDVLAVADTPGTPDQLELSLAAGNRVSRWKALQLVDRASGRVVRKVETLDSNRGPQVLPTVTRAEAETSKLVLAKAKLFGREADMYEIYELTEKLGRSVSLVWEKDAPDSIWGGIGRFFGGVFDATARAVTTVVRTVVTVFEWTVGIVANAVAWLLNLVLAVPVIGAVRMLANTATFVVTTIVGAVVEAVLALLRILGIRQEKLLRLTVVVQQDETGTPVATADQVRPQVEFLLALFQVAANVRVLPGGSPRFTSAFSSAVPPADEYIVFEDGPSGARTLDVSCSVGTAADELLLPGSAFNVKINNSFWGNARRLLGLGGPLVCFAVRGHGGTAVGCSLGPLANHVTVDFAGSVDTTLAHEVGHACGLLHRDGTNLMAGSQPDRATGPADLRDWLTTFQVSTIRSSGRCTLA